MLLLLNRPIGKSLRLEDWERFGKEGAFIADEARKTIIGEIHTFIQQKGTPIDFRVLGRRGLARHDLSWRRLELKVPENASYMLRIQAVFRLIFGPGFVGIRMYLQFLWWMNAKKMMLENLENRHWHARA